MNASKAVDSKLVRRFPIDWKAVAEESGCTKGTLAHNKMFGWHVRNGNGPADICTITPPPVADGETLKIEGSDWCVYSENVQALPARGNNHD